MEYNSAVLRNGSPPVQQEKVASPGKNRKT